MKIKPRRRRSDDAGGDLTPMIDMTFQLIAFFMVVLNFSTSEQDDRVKVPSSKLAIPEEELPENMVSIQILKQAEKESGRLVDLVISGRSIPMSELGEYLDVEKNRFEGVVATSRVSVFIRADAEAPAGRVQEVIDKAQEKGFQIFNLRAREVK